MTKRDIQALYGYPVILASVNLSLETLALLAVPLAFVPILYFLTEISWQNTVLLTLYILSTAPYTAIAFPVLAVTAGIYIYGMKKITGLEEGIATAPAGLTAVVITYSLGLLI
jgi:hypothetical protein